MYQENIFSQSALLASEGIRRSPRGDSVTEPTLGPSGRQLRLNCWLKKRRQNTLTLNGEAIDF